MALTFNLTPNAVLTRKDLPAGSIFVYRHNQDKLFLVPDEFIQSSFNRSYQKDIQVGGKFSGSSEDANMNSEVYLVDLTVSMSQLQTVLK